MVSVNAEHEIMHVDLYIQAADSQAAEQAISAELARVNKELERYTCQADKEDYALAVACGIVAGAVDAFWLGGSPVPGVAPQIVDSKNPGKAAVAISEQLKPLNQRGIEILDTVKKQLVNYDNLTKGTSLESKRVVSVATKQLVEQLVELSYDQSPLGITAAIALQLYRARENANKGKGKSAHTDLDNRTIGILFVSAIITGFLNWASKVKIADADEHEYPGIPRAIIALVALAQQQGVFVEMAKHADKWFLAMAKDLSKGKTPAVDMQSPTSVLYALLKDFSTIPGVKNAALDNALTVLKMEQNIAPKQKFAMLSVLDRQLVPVLLNEALVRSSFLLTRLSRELTVHPSIEEIDWNGVLPFKNRTVDRMLTIASTTLAFADTVDAAVHASLESAGNWVVFSQRFVARYNYVAAGRAIIAVVREAADDVKELELLREKRMLTEAKVAFDVARLEDYKARLTERVDAYLVERLEAFYEGLDMMDQGLATGDSNLVIGGNVVIQRVLGREAQFTDQDEFDELMESDEAFVF